MRHLIILFVLLLAACDQTDGNIALGTLERDRIAHTATAAEVVVALPIEKGSHVRKGDLLVQLDDRLQAAQVEKARALVAESQANLEKLRHGAREEEVAAARAKVDGARASYVESEANYQRIRNLNERKLASQAERDRARAGRDAAQANLQNAREELLKLTKGTREEDLRAAEASLNAATATLAIEQKRLEDLSIVATRDGILDNLPWNLGERVAIGSPLAIVLAGSAPHARIYVPEPYRVKIKVGDELSMRVDGIDHALTGRVRWIATEPSFSPYYALNQDERARLMYLAEVQLPDSDAELPIGLPVQVDLP